MGDLILGAGPYTAPLCGAMTIVIGWLVKQLSDQKGETKEALADAKDLRNKRADDLAKYATEVAEIGEASRVVMRDYCVKMDAQFGAGR
jgi:hypothetical protein